MNAIQLTASVTALANAMACGLNSGELNLLAAVCTQLGDTLATIAAQRDCDSSQTALPGQLSEKASASKR
ncbi:MAG: DUF6774 domain-containing protein [Eubacteriales bacterium]